MGIFVRGGMITDDVRNPLIERDTLAGFLFVERYTHAQAGLRIDHVAAGFEIRFALLQSEPHFGAYGKRHGGIDEATAGTQVHGAGGKARARLQLDHFGGGRKHVAFGDAALGFLRLFGLAVAIDVSVLLAYGRVHDFPWPDCGAFAAAITPTKLQGSCGATARMVENGAPPELLTA